MIELIQKCGLKLKVRHKHKGLEDRRDNLNG